MSDYELDSAPSPKANQAAPATECKTCGGDRFVTVRLRSPHNPAVKDRFYEEVAPCPDCHPIEVSHWRYDGTQFRTMDPAKVREAISEHS